MKYLFIALLAGIGLASCARPNTPPPPKAEPIGLDSPIELRLHPGDSGVAPQEVVRRRLFGLLPPKQVASSLPAPLSQKEGVPRKCKGCTFNLVAGNQTNSVVGKKGTAATGDGAAATSVPKAAAPVATASGDATDNTKAGQRGGAAATGAGSTATAIVEKPPTPWLKYGLWALGAVGGYWLLFGGGGALLRALWRRNKSTANQA